MKSLGVYFMYRAYTGTEKTTFSESGSVVVIMDHKLIILMEIFNASKLLVLREDVIARISTSRVLISPVRK